jgi:hypothetical protein
MIQFVLRGTLEVQVDSLKREEVVEDEAEPEMLQRKLRFPLRISILNHQTPNLVNRTWSRRLSRDLHWANSR